MMKPFENTPSQVNPFLTWIPDKDFLSELFHRYSLARNKGTDFTNLQNIRPLKNDLNILPPQQIHISQRAEQYIVSGKVGIVILAGGMGSRLGRLEPKGTFPITPVKGKSLFEVLIGKIAVLGRFYGVPLRTYIMTNRASHKPTIQFFREKHWFGLSEEDFFFFPQNEMPAMNVENGAILRHSDGSVYTGPDGHGGLITALQTSGAAEDMRQHGIKTVNTFHVDNPLVPILHERFLEIHLEHESDMSSIVVEKADGMELVGNFVYGDPECKTFRVVEYMDFPGSLAMKTVSTGSLEYWAGSIGIHLIQLDFLEEIARKIQNDPLFLPYHLPTKKIRIQDEEVWAIKPERFIFDILPFAKNAQAMKADREDVFTTLKNSPEPVRRHLRDLYASWLRSAGCIFPADAQVEISPDFALDPQTVCEKLIPGTVFNGPEIFLGND